MAVSLKDVFNGKFIKPLAADLKRALMKLCILRPVPITTVIYNSLFFQYLLSYVEFHLIY